MTGHIQGRRALLPFITASMDINEARRSSPLSARSTRARAGARRRRHRRLAVRRDGQRPRSQSRAFSIRGGKFLRVGGDLSVAAPNAERIAVADTETIIPGLFDLHAHYAIELFNAGRKDETAAYPSLFLANGVTATFPAGEMDPNAMRDLRIRIENGVEPGPRLLNSGPYFGTARPGWDRNITAQQIYAEVDHWAELGAKGFKAKGITPDELRR